MFINLTKIAEPLPLLNNLSLVRFSQVLRRNKFATLAIAFAIGLFFVLLCQGIVNAQQSDNIQSLVQQNQETELFWDKLWQSTFSPDSTKGQTNLADIVFNNVVKLFILIGLIFWCWQFGMAMTSQIYGGGQFVSVLLQSFFPLVLSVIFLANNAQAARALGLGLRDYGNDAVKAVLEANISEMSFREAMSDIFITQNAASKIAEQINYCQQLYQPNVVLPSTERPTEPSEINKLSPQQSQAYDYYDCRRKISNVIEEQRRIGEQEQCSLQLTRSPCVFFKRFMDKTKSTVDYLNQKENERIASGGVINPFRGGYALTEIAAGAVASSAQKTILNGIQYWVVSFMEMALFLDALFAPLAISVAIIPARLNMTAGWLISYLTIILAKIGNAVVVGFSSLQLATSASYAISDTKFEMAIGFVAPMVSLAIIGGGGFFAARSFMGASLGVGTALASVASGSVASMAMSISRVMDKKR